ncbi:MAG: 3-methyl-2-oxobutanoate hydroxymethyltransferase [Candidatus Cloacimonadota bacterium]|nr:MAG: 3-methyl-2-oxobutanoate hydroxymethyltransferase [Candidatus Cloacimonadota bacterium]PIE79476.1 MAG: 3-methyl-2-oxobutanoate hydroxymethyltransferase [Candidatus Delongbacteria bacterium]
MEKRLSVSDIYKKYKIGEKLAVLTAYDYSFAKLVDNSGVDMILVGDSLGMVIQGRESTIPVELEHMIYHTDIVVRSTKRAFIVADLPFMSYQVSLEKGLESAMTLMKKGGCGAVKFEGAGSNLKLLERLTESGVPVMGHLGLQPQSINKLGNYKVRGKSLSEATKMIEDARLLEEAGAFSIILEKVTAELAAEITASVNIPTIGIGAGNGCDGQVLVLNDMLGLDEYVKFKFVRKYADLSTIVSDSVKSYVEDVKNCSFPSDKESF